GPGRRSLCHCARPLATAFGIHDRGFVQPGMATLSSSIPIPCSRSRKRRHDEALLGKGTPSQLGGGCRVCFGSTACQSAFAPTTGYLSPPTPWRACRPSRLGGYDSGSSPS